MAGGLQVKQEPIDAAGYGSMGRKGGSGRSGGREEEAKAEEAKAEEKLGSFARGVRI